MPVAPGSDLPDPLLRARTTTANLLGQPLTIEDANGNVLTHEYDGANRLVRIYDPAFLPTVGNYVSYGYDDLGRATSIVNPNGTVGYGYDEAGRVEEVSSPQGTVSYTYTDNGRRETMTLPSAGSGPRVVTYAYDPGSGDLAEIADWTGGDPTEFDVDGLGLPEETRRPNGVTTRYDFDAALRLTGISHVAPGEVALAEFGYEYDANGNRTRLDVTGTAVTNGYELYGYDELNRLDEVRYLDGSEVAFGYDANGNLTLLSPVGGTAIAYEHDLADQLQEVDDVDLFDYDANGNRLTHGADTFSWDWANRLVSADVQGTAVAFTYLGDGSRAQQEIDGTTTVPYLWDRTGGLPRLLDDGTTSAVHAGGVLAEVENASGERAWGLLDGLGSVRARADDAGLVTDTAGWDAWGQATDAPEGLFGWTGEQTDAATGLVYLRARYYSPLYGRFLSTDSVSPNGPGTQGYNPYAYATNNPVTVTDPSGLLPAGLGGVGRAVGNVFALLAALFECYLFGECAYRRRHAGSGGGPGETPGTGGGGGGAAADGSLDPSHGPGREGGVPACVPMPGRACVGSGRPRPDTPGVDRPYARTESANASTCRWCPVPTNPWAIFYNPPFLETDEGVLGLCVGGAGNIPGVEGTLSLCLVSDRHRNVGVALTLALSGIASISVFGGAVGAGGLFSTADSIFELAGWAATGGASIVVTGGEYANTSVARDPEGDLEVTVTAITGVGLSAGIDAGMSYTWVCEWHGCDDAIKGYVQDKFPSRPSFEWRPWKW